MRSSEHKEQRNLALEVTDGKVHDNNMLKKLVNRVLDDLVEPNMTVKKIESVLTNGGAHGTNRNFRYFEHRGIKSGIKIRKNSIISSRNNSLRNREVRLQIENLLK
jgi:hypothetical protein